MKKINFSVLFIITQIIYLTMIFVTIPNVMEFADGNKILDLMPTGYSFEYVQNLLNTLGTQGINIYLFPQLALDFLYPGLFIITFYHAIKLLRNNNTIILSLPILAGSFDYLENILLFSVLKGGYLGETLIQVMSFTTILKSIFTTLTFIIILLLIIKLVYKKLKNSRI